MNEPRIARKARELATDVVTGRIDGLLACIQVLPMRAYLPDVPEDAWLLFSGVASELDGFPVGEERQYWDPQALVEKDRKIADFRARVGPAVNQAFTRLSTLLE